MQDKFSFIALMNNSSLDYLYSSKLLDNVKQRSRIKLLAYIPSQLISQKFNYFANQ